MRLTKILKICNIFTERKSLSLAVMSRRSFTQKQLQLNELKNKELPPQIHSGTVTPANK